MASPDSIVDLVVDTASGAAGLWASSADLAAWRAVEQAGSYQSGSPPPLGQSSGGGGLSSWGSSGSYSDIPTPDLTYGMTAVEPGIPEVENAYLTFEGQRDCSKVSRTGPQPRSTGRGIDYQIDNAIG